MPRIDGINKIVELLESTQSEGLKEIREQAKEAQESSKLFFDKINNFFYGDPKYQELKEQGKENEFKPDLSGYNIMDPVNRGLKLNNLNSNLERYLKDLDKNDKEYALVEEISKLTKEELDRHMDLQNDWFAKKFTPDKDIEPVKSAEQIAIDKAQLDEVMSEGSEKSEDKSVGKDNASEADPEIDKGFVNDKSIVSNEISGIFDTSSVLSDDAVIYEASKSKKHRSAKSAEKDQEPTADSVIAGLKDNEQLTGTREYSKILKTYKSLAKAEKLLKEEYANSEVKETGKELYEKQMAELLKQKKALAVDMDKYIERKSTEREKAKVAGKRENTNSKNRRKAMEAARDFLKKDIEAVEKENGIEKKDRLFENIVGNLEYGNRLTKGQKFYDEIINDAKELDSKPKTYSTISKEANLVGKMYTYLEDKAKSLKGKNGYDFSLNGGKDGKRPPKNNTEKRFMLMLDSMKGVIHRLIEDVETFKPQKREQFIGLIDETNRKLGTDIKTDFKAPTPKDYREQQEINVIKFDKQKAHLIKKIGPEAEEAKKKAEERKAEAEQKKILNKVNKEFDDSFDDDFQDEKIYEFPLRVSNKNVDKVASVAEEILYDSIKASQGEKYDPETYKGEIKTGVYRLGAPFLMKFQENVLGSINPAEKSAEEINNFRMDDKTLDALKSKSLDEAMEYLVGNANRSLKDKKSLGITAKMMTELESTAKALGLEKNLEKKFTYNGKEQSMNDIIKQAHKDAGLDKAAEAPKPDANAKKAGKKL